jgi:hypothetical protein
MFWANEKNMRNKKSPDYLDNQSIISENTSENFSTNSSLEYKGSVPPFLILAPSR